MKKAPTVVMTLRLPAETVEWVDRIAQDRRWSRAQVIRMSLESYRENREAKLPIVHGDL